MHYLKTVGIPKLFTKWVSSPFFLCNILVVYYYFTVILIHFIITLFIGIPRHRSYFLDGSGRYTQGGHSFSPISGRSLSYENSDPERSTSADSNVRQPCCLHGRPCRIGIVENLDEKPSDCGNAERCDGENQKSEEGGNLGFEDGGYQKSENDGFSKSHDSEMKPGYGGTLGPKDGKILKSEYEEILESEREAQKNQKGLDDDCFEDDSVAGGLQKTKRDREEHQKAKEDRREQKKTKKDRGEKQKPQLDDGTLQKPKKHRESYQKPKNHKTDHLQYPKPNPSILAKLREAEKMEVRKIQKILETDRALKKPENQILAMRKAKAEEERKLQKELQRQKAKEWENYGANSVEIEPEQKMEKMDSGKVEKVENPENSGSKKKIQKPREERKKAKRSQKSQKSQSSKSSKSGKSQDNDSRALKKIKTRPKQIKDKVYATNPVESEELLFADPPSKKGK